MGLREERQAKINEVNKLVDKSTEELRTRYRNPEDEKPQVAEVNLAAVNALIERHNNPPKEPEVFYVELDIGRYFQSATKHTSNFAVASYLTPALAEKVLRRLKAKYPNAQLIKSLPVWWTPITKSTLTEVGYPEVLPAIREAIAHAIADGVSREEIRQAVFGATT